MGLDVLCFPAEEESEGHVDEADEDGRVEQSLPHCCRGEECAAAESEEEDFGRRFHEGINDAGSQAWWRHGWGKGDEEVYFFVESWVDC